MNEKDLSLAMEIAKEIKRLVSGVRECYWGRMDPKDVPWNQAADLVSASESAVWCIGWLVREVRRLDNAVQTERDRVESPYIRILSQIRSLGEV